MLGWWESSHTHTYAAHFYQALTTDTRILQRDTGDGLDALSRRSAAPGFFFQCVQKESRRKEQEKEA